MIGAVIWNLITWWKGLPTSSSHALVGSLLGASFFSGGSGNIHWSVVMDKIIWPMLASPVFGIVGGFYHHDGIDMADLQIVAAADSEIIRQAANFVSRVHGVQSRHQ